MPVNYFVEFSCVLFCHNKSVFYKNNNEANFFFEIFFRTQTVVPHSEIGLPGMPRGAVTWLRMTSQSGKFDDSIIIITWCALTF